MKNILFPLAIGMMAGWFLSDLFGREKIWCLPYEISLEKQAERGIETTEVGKLFAPDPGTEHAYWCYQKT